MRIEKNKNFIDWFSNIFGYCYGSGERPILEAINELMIECTPNKEHRSYDYIKLEESLGARATWLLINALCNDDILEYGTSPRFAWLTPRGEILREFIGRHTLDELEEMLNIDLDPSSDNYYIHCYPECCNCGPEGYEEEKVCDNPMFNNGCW